MMKSILELAQAQADKILRSPKTLSLLADPRVQKTIIQLINLRGELRKTVSGKVQGFAKDYSLATREDMAKMRRTIRDMERTIGTLQKELDAIKADEVENKASKGAKKPVSRKPKGTSKKK